ncbi:hypothetical protein JL721_9282 [Aureococcus anophagefferens]|nr:hypothetical protein JL721_9282 [Aureococcus anophagefferens]
MATQASFGDMPVRDFVAALSAKQPTPGGGAAAALAAALGDASGAMACVYTQRKKDRERGVFDKAKASGDLLTASALSDVAAADADAAAYAALQATWKKDCALTEAEKDRVAADALAVPVDLLERCYLNARDVAAFVPLCNPNIVSDAKLICGCPIIRIHRRRTRIATPGSPRRTGRVGLGAPSAAAAASSGRGRAATPGATRSPDSRRVEPRGGARRPAMSYGAGAPIAFADDDAVRPAVAEADAPARSPGRTRAACAAALVRWRRGRRRAGPAAGRPAAAALDATSTTSTATSLPARVNISVSNAYERKAGRQTGDGLYPCKYLVEVHQPTTFEVTDLSHLPASPACTWTLGTYVDATSGCASVSHIFDAVGEEYVTFNAFLSSTGESLSYSFAVHVKYVRREIRELTAEDRERYLGAVQVIYNTDTATGQQLYGSAYRGSEWLVREHLYGAASKMCDHWHDDAGFLNHHVGITWQFETAMQAVDARVAAHYWDYTIDASLNETDQFSSSLLFSEDWFGTPSPVNGRHVVDAGRFAFTKVKSAAREFSAITNPYGLLRSPWNTNSAPYLMRFQQVMGVKYDDYSLAGCSVFTDTLQNFDSIAAFTSKLNGQLHGPIHIMIGGHWWFKNSTDNKTLATKTAHDMGLGGAPSDAAWEDCACSCPAEIVGTSDADAYDVLNKSGLIDINTNWKNPNLFGMTWRDVLDFLCHVGHPGEMFTSAAPQDPTFWPLHGNAERFMHLVRLLNAQGDKHLDETWGYMHVTTGLDSDTHAVCNWTGVEGMGMPPHKFSNSEFYNYTSPLNKHVPYVYDRLTFWPSCHNQTIWHGNLSTIVVRD